MNICNYLFPLLISATFATPVKYDQRQDGEVNVRADLQNFVIVALIPKLDGAAAGSALLNAISKTFPERKSDRFPIRRHFDEIEDLPDARNEPLTEKKNTPYHVDITQAKNSESNNQQVKETPKSSVSQATTPKLKKSPGAGADNPAPDVLPVKDNKYVPNGRRNGRRSLDYSNDIAETTPEQNDDYSPKVPEGVQYWLLGSRENCGPDAYRDASLLCVPCPKGQAIDFESGVCKEQ